jgi:hypothetical protein
VGNGIAKVSTRVEKVEANCSVRKNLATTAESIWADGRSLFASSNVDIRIGSY